MVARALQRCCCALYAHYFGGGVAWQGNSKPQSAVQVAFTALGRMEAMARRPEGAMEAARRTLAAGHPAKLRIFTPALRAFCAEGDHAKAFEAGLSPAKLCYLILT